MSRTSSYEALRAAVREAVVGPAGSLDQARREAIVRGETLEGPLGAYVATVREEAHRVTDEQVAALGAAGHPDDAVFEATVCAAIGAGLMRLDRVRAAKEAADAAT